MPSPDDLAPLTPLYKVVDQEQHEDDGNTVNVTLVQLAKPHIFRKAAKTVSYLESDYALVSSATRKITDSSGTFWWEETTVTASDESGKITDGLLFMVPRALTVQEAMFSIGEI